MSTDQFAPQPETYLDAPEFQYSPNQREIDFAQLIAGGADPVDALVRSSMVTARDANNLTRSTLYQRATSLINRPSIQERLDYFLLLQHQSMSTTVERLQQELASVGYADFAQMFHPETGAPITNPHDLPRHLRAAVKEWWVDKDGVVKFKFHDKLKAMQMLGDLSGHFNDAHEAAAPKITVTLGASDPVPAAIDVTPTLDCLE